MASEDGSDPPEHAEVHRLHPLSLLFRVASSIKLVLVPLVLVVFAGGRDDGEPWWVALFVLPGLVHSVVHYLTYRYRFQGDELVVRGGLLFRNERHVPYARIQNIDMTQGPFHRLLGVADVRIETAGGAEPEARLQVLSLSALEAMRERVFAPGRATPATSDESPGDPADASARERPTRTRDGRAASGDDDVEPLLRLRLVDLVLFGVISNRGMAVVLAALGLTHELGLFERIHVEDSFWQGLLPAWEGAAGNLLLGAGVVLGVLVLLRTLSIVWALLYLGGFQLTRHGDDLRSHAGLLTRVSTTIPRRRIQVVTIRETLLHRLFGRVAITVDTAGGDSMENARQSTRRWLAPLLPRGDVARLLRRVQPGLELDDVQWQPVHSGAARRLARRWWLLAFLATAAAAAWVGLAPGDRFGLGRVTEWLLVVGLGGLVGLLGQFDARARARRLGWSVEQDAVWIRQGLWTRTTRVVRDGKAQLISVHSSPFDRRWGMARLVVDAAGCNEPVSQPLLPSTQAAALRERLAARVGTTAFRW